MLSKFAIRLLIHYVSLYHTPNALLVHAMQDIRAELLDYETTVPATMSAIAELSEIIESGKGRGYEAISTILLGQNGHPAQPNYWIVSQEMAE